MSTADLANQVEHLKLFLAMAPTNWNDPSQQIKRFCLPNNDVLSCILWKNIFYITGTDIVKVLSFRFLAIGRPVKNIKKFEEGVFSDLRNLKPGQDAALEEPRSEFLEFLYKNNCIRTQKKQKVFYWYSVPHDRLFIDALERDLKREAMGQETATVRAMHMPTGMSMGIMGSSPPLHPHLIDMQQHNTVAKQMMQQQSNNDDTLKLDEWIADRHALSDSPNTVPPSLNHSMNDLHSESPDILSNHLKTMEALSSILENNMDNNLVFNQKSMANSNKAEAQLEQKSMKTPSQQMTPSPNDTPNLVPIAPKVLPASPFIAANSPPGITLEGSPNYKKQRRRSSIFRMSQSKPYAAMVRRHTQPAIHYEPLNQIQHQMATVSNSNSSMDTQVIPYDLSGITAVEDNSIANVNDPNLINFGDLSLLGVMPDQQDFMASIPNCDVRSLLMS